jgi:hypothetical protein
MTHENNKDEIRREAILESKSNALQQILGEGGSFFEGESPVPRLTQVKTELQQWVSHRLKDPDGALVDTFQQYISRQESLLEQHFDTPLEAIKIILKKLLAEKILFTDFVRQIDQNWGKKYQEKPHFQTMGQKAHPDDEYTLESVRNSILDLLQELENKGDELHEQ